MTKQVEVLDASNRIRYSDITEPGSGSTGEPLVQIKNGVVVSNVAESGQADDYTGITRYKNGAVHTYIVHHADGSQVLLVFQDPDKANAYVQVGEKGEKIGPLLSSSYTAPTSLPAGGTRFILDQEFSNGRLTKYDLQALDSSGAHLTGTYDIATQASKITLVTADKGTYTTGGHGQIDALNKLSAAHIISQDGNSLKLISEHGGGFEIVSDYGNGLISQDGNSWSVISNDGGTLSLISQDGNSLNLFDVAGLIGEKGNGLRVTTIGDIVAQGGGNIVGQGGGNFDPLGALDGKVLIATEQVKLHGYQTGVISKDRPSELVANGNPVKEAAVESSGLGTYISNGSTGGLHVLAFQAASTPADLTVTTAFLDHTTSGAPYHFGDTLNVSWQVKNIGEGISGSTTSTVYLSTDAAESTDDKPIGSLIDPTLGSGNAVSDTFDYHLPSNLDAGTHYIYVKANAVDHANPADDVREEESNNRSDFISFFLKSASDKPDLTVPIKNLNLSASSGYTGDRISVNFAIKETAGNDASATFSTGIYLSKDQTLDASDKQLGSVFSFDGISAATALAYGVYADIPENLAPGTYYIFVTADVAKTTSESNESNNTQFIAFTVKDAPKPDLTVPVVLLDKTSAHAGDTVNVSWSVKETANVAASGSTSKIYLSTDATITASDTLLSSLIDPVLGTGNSVSDTLDVKLPSNLAAGTYYIGVIADGENAVDEKNETNNASAGVKITVTANTAAPTIKLDPITGDDLVSKADLKAGVTVTGKTTNVEDGKTVTVTLEKSHSVPLVAATAVVHDGTFSLTLPPVSLGSGSGSLLAAAEVKNSAGKSADSEHAFNYDLTAPKLGLVGENVAVKDGGYDLNVLGTVEKSTGTTVHIMLGTADLGPVEIDAQGHWSYGAFIPGSSVKLSAMAVDLAGNTTKLALLDASVTGGVKTGKGDDVLTGDKHGNILDGDKGSDTLIGGKGSDTLIGGKGEDAASYENASKGVTASLLKSSDNKGDAKGDTYSSIEDLRGSKHGDKLTGDENKNFLFGDAGADQFVFAKFNADADDLDGIYDFHHAENDKIALDHKLFKTLTVTDDKHPFDKNWFKDIGADGAKEDKSDRILYNSDNGVLSYDRDGSGKAHAVDFAQLTNLEHLKAGDFIVI